MVVTSAPGESFVNPFLGAEDTIRDIFENAKGIRVKVRDFSRAAHGAWLTKPPPGAHPQRCHGCGRMIVPAIRAVHQESKTAQNEHEFDFHGILTEKRPQKRILNLGPISNEGADDSGKSTPKRPASAKIAETDGDKHPIPGTSR